MGECGPAGSPFVHSFGHTFLFQNSGMKLRPLPLNSTFGLSASTPSYGRQTSLPLSSRMTCTSLERLALLLSLSLSVALLGRTGAEPFVRCSTKVTHYIDTCHLPPSPSPSLPLPLPSCLPAWLCALSNWYANHCTALLATTDGRTDGRENAEWRNECRHRERELCRLLHLRWLFFSLLLLYSGSIVVNPLLVRRPSTRRRDTNTMGNKRRVRMQRSHCSLSPSLSPSLSLSLSPSLILLSSRF